MQIPNPTAAQFLITIGEDTEEDHLATVEVGVEAIAGATAEGEVDQETLEVEKTQWIAEKMKGRAQA